MKVHTAIRKHDGGKNSLETTFGTLLLKLKKQEESVCSVLSVDPRLRSSPCGVSRVRCARQGRTLAGPEGRWSGACSRPGSVGSSLL